MMHGNIAKNQYTTFLSKNLILKEDADLETA